MNEKELKEKMAQPEIAIEGLFVHYEEIVPNKKQPSSKKQLKAALATYAENYAKQQVEEFAEKVELEEYTPEQMAGCHPSDISKMTGWNELVSIQKKKIAKELENLKGVGLHVI